VPGLSALLNWYFFLAPQNSFERGSFGQGLRLVVFALEGAVISLLVGLCTPLGEKPMRRLWPALW